MSTYSKILIWLSFEVYCLMALPFLPFLAVGYGLNTDRLSFFYKDPFLTLVGFTLLLLTPLWVSSGAKIFLKRHLKKVLPASWQVEIRHKVLGINGVSFVVTEDLRALAVELDCRVEDLTLLVAVAKKVKTETIRINF